MASGQVMITGGDGYLGLEIARRYLATTDATLLLWLHADGRAVGDTALEAKRVWVTGLLGPDADRVSFAAGDLEGSSPFDSIDPAGVRAIVHAAGATRFNVAEDVAERVNVEGTVKLLELALRCTRLEALGLLSTVYASGLAPGRIEESAFDGESGFANHYERSKWKAETALLTRYASLPWRILRIATAIADDESGRVSQQNAFHNTLKLFFYGLLSLLPGHRETPLYFVTGEFVAGAVVELMERTAAPAIYHVAHTRAESLGLGELVDLAFSEFTADADFRSRRVLKPLYADAEAFDLLAGGIQSFGGAVVSQAIGSVVPFAPQLFVSKEIDNSRLVESLAAYHAPDPRELIRRCCAHLVRTRWGRLDGRAA